MLTDAGFAAMEARAAERAITAHCSTPAGVCEGCERRPAAAEDGFCRVCIEGDPRLRAVYFGEAS